MLPLSFEKVKDVKSPKYSTEGSAGIDIFVPNNFSAVVKPNERILIPSGLKFNIPNNYALIAFNKSGVCNSTGLIVGACVIDCDYTGEVHIHLINTSNFNVGIKPGNKIIQLLLIPVAKAILNEVPNINKQTDRGSGGFGSTGLI